MGVDGIIHAGSVQMGLYAFQVLFTVAAQVIDHHRRGGGDLGADGGLTVQNAHGVAVETFPAGGAEFIDMGGKVGL